MRDLLSGSKKFSDFLDSAEPLPTNLLANRLARLVEEEYVVKTQYQDRPKRFEYAITEKGKSLVPVMQAMVNWAQFHLDGLEPARAALVEPKTQTKAKTKQKVAKAEVKEAITQSAFDF